MMLYKSWGVYEYDYYGKDLFCSVNFNVFYLQGVLWLKVLLVGR